MRGPPPRSARCAPTWRPSSASRACPTPSSTRRTWPRAPTPSWRCCAAPASTTCRSCPCRRGAPAVSVVARRRRARRRCCCTPTTTSSRPGTTPTGTARPSSRPSVVDASTGAVPPTTRPGVIAHVGALRVLGDDSGVGRHGVHRGRGGDRLADVHRVPARLPGPAPRGRHRRRRLLQLGDRGPGADHVPARPGGLRGRGGRAGARRALGHVRRRGPRRAHPAGTPDHHAPRRRGQRRRRRSRARAGPDRRLRRGHVPRRRERARRGPPGGHRTDHGPAVDPPRDRRHRVRRPPRGQRVEHDHRRARRPSSPSVSHRVRTRTPRWTRCGRTWSRSAPFGARVT